MEAVFPPEFTRIGTVGGDSRIYYFGIYFFHRNYLFVEDLLIVSRF
jgi:hypothetical protein